jgi:hypothetical protein
VGKTALSGSAKPFATASRANAEEVLPHRGLPAGRAGAAFASLGGALVPLATAAREASGLPTTTIALTCMKLRHCILSSVTANNHTSPCLTFH